MNHYIFRKKLFALLFLLIVPAFSLWNFLGARQTLSEKLRVRATQVSQGDITLGQAVSGMETAITETVRGRMNFIEGYSFIQTLLGKEEFNNFSYVKDQEGFLHYAAFFREPDREVAGYTARLRRLADAAAEYDGKVLFTVVPSKYIPGVTQFSPGLQINDPNPLVDETLFYVNRYGIATLDMRGSIPNEVLPFDKTFFRTDHHWTIPAAFEGFRQLVEALNREFDAGLDPDGFYRDPNNYTQVTYQGGMLGSMGRKTGATFAHPEDFTALWPNFSGNFYRECLEENGSTTVHQGDITHTLLTTRFNGWTVALLFGGALITCVLQFFLGKAIGYYFPAPSKGEDYRAEVIREDLPTDMPSVSKVTAGQAFGQKNTTLGVWMAQTYLCPLAALGPAAYIIWQNIFNSIQLLVLGKGKPTA